MKPTLESGAADQQKTQCLVLFVSKEKQAPAVAQINTATGKLLDTLTTRGDLPPVAGKTLLLPAVTGIPAERLLLVATGEQPLTAPIIDKLCAGLAAGLKSASVQEATVVIDGLAGAETEETHLIALLARSVVNASYCFREYKSTQEEEQENEQTSRLEQVTFLQSDQNNLEQNRQALAEGSAVATGMTLARNLGNEPGNVCTPSWLAQQAQTVAQDNARMEVKVLGEQEMQELGMEAFVSVSKGSSQEGKLISIRYSGGQTDEAPVVLLGKGITFDTGGISLKPGAGMEEMKYDMCGAASVLGTMKALAELQLPLNVVGLIAAAENMPAGNASKPGDIVTSLSGQTIEIINTDAEGRLVLCDALTWAEQNLKPAVVIDIATLTGACVIALGHHISALMSNDDNLAEQLVAAAERSRDTTWRLPLDDRFQKQIDSPFADVCNSGGRPAGSITAGCFLSRFARNLCWAHLDIAGVAWKSDGEKGATGRPVPLLVQYLMDRALAKH
ncbi:MAG: leucyl aminopeptidase [Kistimonas sp.]|nr:leucyl aminopeptidase [Kistimonas sp.]